MPLERSKYIDFSKNEECGRRADASKILQTQNREGAEF
jgi:hypothetical protein